MEDVEEINQETAANLSNDELKELTEQEENKNIDSSVAISMLYPLINNF